MERHKMQPLSKIEKSFAENNHNLVYGFLHRYGYSIDEYYNIAILGYLKAVQVYQRRKDLCNRYDFPFIAWQYMRSEMGNYFRITKSQKRNPTEMVISLDAYDRVSTATCICESDINFLNEVFEHDYMYHILKNSSLTQQKIVWLKIIGYTNKEVYKLLNIKPSTYYKEMKRIKTVTKKLLAD